jgi:hypothetical protein
VEDVLIVVVHETVVNAQVQRVVRADWDGSTRPVRRVLNTCKRMYRRKGRVIIFVIDEAK